VNALSMLEDALSIGKSIFELAVQNEQAELQQIVEKQTRLIEGYIALDKVNRKAFEDKQNDDRAVIDKLMRSIRDLQQEINNLKGCQ